jgi:catechol 2,3-dioxygenase-like lactoylglutathione lyase family enzyme/nitrite reductase/ring-hydroxylating ferredoxin subunit
MAMIDGFSHMVLHVTDLERSEKFYQEVFGLDLVGRNLVADEGPNSLLAMNTRQRILLVEVPEVVAIRPNSSSIHHAWLLTIDEMTRAKKRLKKMGFDIEDSRAQFRANGENSLDVFDPDGHRFQVQAYGPEATAIVCENTGPINCGHVDDFPVGTVKAFVKGKFFLVRIEEGFLAVSRWCTHMNGLLTWKKEHWHFYCPMHGAMFNRKGESMPCSRDAPTLRLHPLTIGDDGTITVDPDTAIRRDGFLPEQAVQAQPATQEA